MSAPYLPFIADSLFNTPLALHSNKAQVICAVLAGRLNIEALVTESGRMDARAMQALAEMGREGYIQGSPVMGRGVKVPGGTLAEVHSEGRPYNLTESGTAIIPVMGTLVRTWGVGPESGKTGYDGLWTQFLYANQDPLCRRIWMPINSGGGHIDGLFDLSDGIYSMSARFGGKPIHAHAADYAYSAAHVLMCAADTTSVPEAGGVGSDAAIMIHVDITRALEEDGIEPIIFRSGSRKAIGTGGIEKLDDRAIAHKQDQIDKIGAIMTGRLATYLGRKESDISKLQGEDYNGADAKAIGLVKEVLSEPEAWAKHERRAA